MSASITEADVTPGVRMMYLIRRRPETSREELIAHWFANHMPSVIERNVAARAAGKAGAWRYVATLFDPRGERPQAWDGVAQLWYDSALPMPDAPHGEPPRDTFQEKVEPYWPWAAQEYVAIDGDLPLAPPTLNEPFPCTRSGFLKVTFLVPLKEGVAAEALYRHWLEAHLPNVRESMLAAGGFRYVVAHSLDPHRAPFAGMAELYFPDAAAYDAFKAHIKPDGMEEVADPKATLVFHSGTEMVGIA